MRKNDDSRPDPISFREKLIGFIKKLQKSDGGFSVTPALRATSALYTDYALDALSYLHAADEVDTAHIKSYLSALKGADGGFRFDGNMKDSSLQATYYAVHDLFLIGALDVVDKPATIAFIKKYEKKDAGGFSFAPVAGEPDIKSTYMAVYTLKTLGLLDEATKRNAVRFLLSTPYVGMPTAYEVTQKLEDACYAIMALKLLGAERSINKKRLEAFINSFYISANGGFAPLRGYGAAPDPTYFGLRCLVELGALKMANIQ